LLATELLPFGDALIERFALFNAASPLFHSYQVFTYMFLHGGISHLFFNMFALWMFGRTLELELGSQRFFTYYMVCGIGAALIQLGVSYAEYAHMLDAAGVYAASRLLAIPTVGASGAVFGLLLAFGVLHPNNRIMLMFPPVVLKAKWFVLIYGLIELVFGMSGYQAGGAHFAHLGGMIWGFGLLYWWKKQRKIFF
jgi:membrane associated rhomboid family serine protease